MFEMIARRIWQDYFMPARFDELEKEIRALQSYGYKFHSVHGFIQLVQSEPPLTGKNCILRIDVDSDPHCCLEFSKIFNRLQLPATFYFRLSTLNGQIMRRLRSEGYEVGYHFEEIATFAKAEKILEKQVILDRLEEPRNKFRENYAKFNTVFGETTHTVASHGDFANRKLGLTNSCLLNIEIREDLNIVCEAYDESLTAYIDDMVIDTSPPQWWRPDTPSKIADTNTSGQHAIRILIHPKQWRKSYYWNTLQAVQRLIEGWRYR